jgi:hypothetical protein
MILRISVVESIKTTDCGCGFDFGKVSVPVPFPDLTYLSVFQQTNKIRTKSCFRSSIVFLKVVLFFTFVYGTILCWIRILIQIRNRTGVHYGSGSCSAEAKSYASCGSGFGSTTLLRIG